MKVGSKGVALRLSKLASREWAMMRRQRHSFRQEMKVPH